MSVLRPDLMLKCVIPVIMAGIIAVSLRFSVLPATVSNRSAPRIDLRLGRVRTHRRGAYVVCLFKGGAFVDKF